jgi:hypothetical protein
MFVGCKRHPREPAKYWEARRLRSAGTPFKQIAKRLEISPATAHRWTADIELTREQEAAIAREAERRWTARAASWSETCQARRRSYQEQGRAKAREQDALHMMGTMLYWAEGAKDRNALVFANSDPGMVGLFVRFLREALGAEEDRISMRINVYLGNGLRIEEIEAYWLEITGLSASSLRAHTINHFPTSSSGRRAHKLPYGVCAIAIYSTQLVQHVFGAIQEYSDVDEPDWLDGARPSRVLAEQ